MGYSRYSQYSALSSRRLHPQVNSNLSRIHNMIGPHVSRQCLWKWSPSFYSHEKVTPSRCKCKSRCHSANFTEEAGPFGYALAPEYLFCQHTEAWSHGVRSTAFFLISIRERYNSFSKLGNIRKEKEALIIIMSWHPSADSLFPCKEPSIFWQPCPQFYKGDDVLSKKRPIFLALSASKKAKVEVWILSPWEPENDEWIVWELPTAPLLGNWAHNNLL